jgi:hypothetical protein
MVYSMRLDTELYSGWSILIHATNFSAVVPSKYPYHRVNSDAPRKVSSVQSLRVSLCMCMFAFVYMFACLFDCVCFFVFVSACLCLCLCLCL